MARGMARGMDIGTDRGMAIGMARGIWKISNNSSHDYIYIFFFFIKEAFTSTSKIKQAKLNKRK